MSPPELAGDVPVPNALEPVDVRGFPPLREQPDASFAYGSERRLRQRFDLDEPLIRQPRFHHRVAPVAVTHRVSVRLDALELTEIAKHLDHFVARGESVHPAERFRYATPSIDAVFHSPIGRKNYRHRKIVPLPDLEIVGVVGWSDLERARSE